MAKSWGLALSAYMVGIEDVSMRPSFHHITALLDVDTVIFQAFTARELKLIDVGNLL